MPLPYESLRCQELKQRRLLGATVTRASGATIAGRFVLLAFAEYPLPLVPRSLRHEVSERITVDGRVIKTLNASEVRRVLDDLHQARRIRERRGGVVGQGHEGPAEAHAAGPGVGEAELERHDGLLGPGPGRRSRCPGRNAGTGQHTASRIASAWRRIASTSSSPTCAPSSSMIETLRPSPLAQQRGVASANDLERADEGGGSLELVEC